MIVQRLTLSILVLVFLEESSQFIFSHYTAFSVFSRLLLLPLIVGSIALIFALKELLYQTSIYVFLILFLSFFWLKDQLPQTIQKENQPVNEVLFYSQNVHQFCNESVVFDQIVEQVKRSKAQVVCIQEFGMKSRWPSIKSVSDEFSNKIDLPYYDFTPTPGNVFGTAVFSKYPIQKVDTIFQLLSYTNEAKYYQINKDGSEIKFINAHLQSFNLKSFFTNETMTLSHILKLKAEQLFSILNYQLKSDIILGDFNILPGSCLYDLILNSGYRDVQVQKGNPMAPTLPMIFNRIDYVFVTPKISIQNFQMLDQSGSDHRALVVKLAL